MNLTRKMNSHGDVSITKLPNPDSSSLKSLLYYSFPYHSFLSPEQKQWRKGNFNRICKEIYKIQVLKGMVKGLHIPSMYSVSALYLEHIKESGERLPLGLAGVKLVTDVGVGYIVDAWQNSVELEDMKYHGIGLGTTAANQTDTDIETELTTQYIVNSTRATGSLTEGATANIFRTVGTNTVDATAAITEHGILSSATVGAGVLLDRTVFTVINLASGDSLQSTYDLTLTAGG